mmetsp:Transcript_24671/g.77899  ORF Transcript_24671/g.77899 Transcript_24671/m.77899 type:complete len:225 (-) Transcript_24671:326-1000(-)
MMPLAAAAHARPLRLNSSPPLHPTRRALPSCRAPLPAAGTRWQSRSRPQLRSCAASGGGGELKQRIVKTAGDKNGLDLSAEAKKGVEGLIAELEAINPTPNPARVDLGGTKWELVYSSTAGASGGKLGPFIGQVTQVFPAGEGEIYFNIVELGPLKAALKAEFSCESDDKLKVTFVDTTFSLGPLATTKVFEERRGGTWRMSYSDDDFRVLYANTGNVFVLRRI